MRFLSPSLRGEFLGKGCLHSHAREAHCTHKYRGVSLDFPALPNAIELCAVTLRWFRTNQRQSSNSAQNTTVRNANDQLLQSRFISGFRNDIRRFVLARDPINLEESISAALFEEQNVNLNQIANDERSGHRQAECRKKKWDERRANYQPPPRRKAASEFSVFRHPVTPSFDRRHVHFQESAFRDNYAAPRHSASGSHTTSRNRDFQRNTRNDNLNFSGENRF
ncbi:hypothetical protein TNCV_2898461 [Trichonephila clavipes]|nr:hypothetical protein TNCV_2898461 [Trichonephila clavipes]